MELDARLERRFIFLTGDTVNEATKSFLRSTGQPFLAKPFRLASIEEVTRQTLGAAQGASLAIPLANGPGAS
jgi:hypothetical protein